MAKYREKTVGAEVDAVRLLWENWSEICDHAGIGPDEGQPKGVYVEPDGGYTLDALPAEHSIDDCKLGVHIPTPEGATLGVEGDWIVKDEHGKTYPCGSHFFAATYEPVG